jgi:hypothetical protein
MERKVSILSSRQLTSALRPPWLSTASTVNTADHFADYRFYRVGIARVRALTRS